MGQLKSFEKKRRLELVDLGHLGRHLPHICPIQGPRSIFMGVEMSERYSGCPKCRGRGKIHYYDDTLFRYEFIPCPRCEATGFSGDSTTQQDHLVNLELERQLAEQDSPPRGNF